MMMLIASRRVVGVTLSLIVGCCFCSLQHSHAFVLPRTTFGHWPVSPRGLSAAAKQLRVEDDSRHITAIRAPLKFVGPYPAISLRFPHLSTQSQKQRNTTGISLDFVLDTAANINTINGQVAQELGLEVVGQAPPGVLATGPFVAGGENTFLLGDCQLEGAEMLESHVPDDESFLFMTNLTASVLPGVNPGFAAGLLSDAFLKIFDGGVEFSWGTPDNTTEMPTVTFHSALPSNGQQTWDKATITRIPITLLPSVTVAINGVDILALLDTGSPITVLNQAAARTAKVEAAIKLETSDTLNPFTKLDKNMQLARAAAAGDVLQLARGGGQPINLIRSKDEVDVFIKGSEDGKKIEFGKENKIFIGDLPGLQALNGLGVDSPPAVVLGTDILRRRPRMLYRGNENEIYFGR